MYNEDCRCNEHFQIFELVDKFSFQELWALRLDLDVVMVYGYPWVELHSVEIREEIDGSTLLAKAGSYHGLTGHRTVESCRHFSFACTS